MTNQSVVCSKCGYANVAGDQFCGSCGAFLEWESTPADAGAPAAGAAAAGAAAGPAVAGPVPGAGVAPPAQPGTWGQPAPVASPSSAGAGTPTAPIPAPPAPTTDALLRCPSCGIANPVSRTFCQSCGAKLGPASAIGSRSRDEIAAAVAAVPAAPRPAAGGGTAPAWTPAASAPPAKKRGIGIWVLVIVVLGVLAGVGFVVVPQLLKGSGPSTAASAAPTPSGPAASGGVAASGSAGSSTSPGASGSTSPSASARPAGKPLKLTGASASSILGGDTTNYGPQNAIDGKLKTSWQEGSDTENGQWIEVSFASASVTRISIRNGFQASTALYKANLRPKNILVSLNGGTPIPVLLKDTTNAQAIVIPANTGTTSVRITIVDTYPSVKTAISGSPFQDAAISEIAVDGVVGG